MAWTLALTLPTLPNLPTLSTLSTLSTLPTRHIGLARGVGTLGWHVGKKRIARPLGSRGASWTLPFPASATTKTKTSFRLLKATTETVTEGLSGARRKHNDSYMCGWIDPIALG